MSEAVCASGEACHRFGHKAIILTATSGATVSASRPSRGPSAVTAREGLVAIGGAARGAHRGDRDHRGQHRRQPR